MRKNDCHLDQLRTRQMTLQTRRSFVKSDKARQMHESVLTQTPKIDPRRRKGLQAQPATWVRECLAVEFLEAFQEGVLAPVTLDVRSNTPVKVSGLPSCENLRSLCRSDRKLDLALIVSLQVAAT